MEYNIVTQKLISTTKHIGNNALSRPITTYIDKIKLPPDFDIIKSRWTTKITISLWFHYPSLIMIMHQRHLSYTILSNETFFFPHIVNYSMFLNHLTMRTQNLFDMKSNISSHRSPGLTSSTLHLSVIPLYSCMLLSKVFQQLQVFTSDINIYW